MNEITSWLLWITLSSGQVVTVDNLATQSECRILGLKIQNNQRDANARFECYALRRERH